MATHGFFLAFELTHWERMWRMEIIINAKNE
jgi:hypothetical protein